jgi:hypothetical protein
VEELAGGRATGVGGVQGGILEGCNPVHGARECLQACEKGNLNSFLWEGGREGGREEGVQSEAGRPSGNPTPTDAAAGIGEHVVRIFRKYGANSRH